MANRIRAIKRIWVMNKDNPSGVLYVKIEPQDGLKKNQFSTDKVKPPLLQHAVI